MSDESLFARDFTEVLAVLEAARVVDFVRFVGREMRDNTDLADMRFKDGWMISLGAYAQLAAREPAESA